GPPVREPIPIRSGPAAAQLRAAGPEDSTRPSWRPTPARGVGSVAQHAGDAPRVLDGAVVDDDRPAAAAHDRLDGVHDEVVDDVGCLDVARRVGLAVLAEPGGHGEALLDHGQLDPALEGQEPELVDAAGEAVAGAGVVELGHGVGAVAV